MLNPENTTNAEFGAILHGTHGHPHNVLGMHTVAVGQKKQLLVRAVILDAESCEVVDCESHPEHRYTLAKIASEGVLKVSSTVVKRLSATACV